MAWLRHVSSALVMGGSVGMAALGTWFVTSELGAHPVLALILTLIVVGAGAVVVAADALIRTRER